MNNEIALAGWQEDLKNFRVIDEKITLQFVDEKLLQDYVPVFLNGELSFMPMKPALSLDFGDNTVFFSLHGFHSYSDPNLDEWIRRTANTKHTFIKTLDDGILPQVKDNNLVYPECANLIRKIFTSPSETANTLIVDCRSIKDSLSPDAFSRITLLFDEMYSACNRILFLTVDEDDVPCKCAHKIEVGYPDYQIRSSFLSQKRFSEAPIIKKAFQDFILLSGSYPLITIEKLVRLSTTLQISDARKLIDYYTKKNRKNPFSTYDKPLIEERLRTELSRVKGNSSIKEKIIRDIVSLFGGIKCCKNESKVPLIYLLMGLPGVGKTEIARCIGDAFGAKNNVIFVSMSNNTSDATVNDLLGSSHGYVGFADHKSPFENLIGNDDISIVIFDEIEKAHPKVIHSLLKCLNDGHLYLRDGRLVDFTHSFIFFTSNLGIKKARLGENGEPILDAYGQPLCEPTFDLETPPEEIKNMLVKSVVEFYDSQGIPEFINRIGQDHLLPMCPLDEHAVQELVLQLCENAKTVAAEDFDCVLRFSTAAYNKLIEIGLKHRLESGRGIKRTIDSIFNTTTSFKPGTKILDIDADDNVLVFKDENNNIIKKEID